MSAAMSMGPLVRKEFRALLVPWAALIGTIVVAGVIPSNWRAVAAAAYFIGVPALGALSVAHDYEYRTMGMLLTPSRVL